MNPYRLSTAILILFLAITTTASHIAYSAPEAPGWLRPGLRVAYVAVAASLATSPWASMSATLDQVVAGGGDWGGPVPIPKPGSVQAVTVFEHYVVEGIDARGVHMFFSQWSLAESTGSIEYEILTPHKKPFNGPFWVDPRLLAGAREGSTVVIPQEGRSVEYRVVFAGDYLVSPLAKGPGSLEEKGSLAPLLPLPPETRRSVVGLQAIIDTKVVENGRTVTKRLVHEMIVDRETGVILVEALMERTGESRAVYMRQLAEINIDLEDVLPSYATKSYDYTPLAHVGYVLDSYGLLVPRGGSALDAVIVRLGVSVIGVYKDRALINRMVFIGLKDSPFARFYVDLENLETGRVEILYYQDPISGGTGEVGTSYGQGPLLLAPGLVGKEAIEVYGVEYRAAGTGEAEIEGLGRVKLYAYQASDERASLRSLLYAEYQGRGVLVSIQPGGLPGYDYQPPPQGGGSDAPNTPRLLSALDERAKKASQTAQAQNTQTATTTTPAAPPATTTTPVTTSTAPASTTTSAEHQGQDTGQASTTATTQPQPSNGGGGGEVIILGWAVGAAALAVIAFYVLKRLSRGSEAPPPPPPPPG